MLLGLMLPAACLAGIAADELPIERMQSADPGLQPVLNAGFAPGTDARKAPPFAGTLTIASSPLRTEPELHTPVLEGRDGRVFPGITLSFVTDGATLIPAERGAMVRETSPGANASYWRVIPQFGRVWREAGDGDWSRAAFPLMLVNDTENHAHQGLAMFLYKDRQVSRLRVQFVQQTAPYLQSPHCVLWGTAQLTVAKLDSLRATAERAAAKTELAVRLPSRPLAELRKRLPPARSMASADLSCRNGRWPAHSYSTARSTMRPNQPPSATTLTHSRCGSACAPS